MPTTAAAQNRRADTKQKIERATLRLAVERRQSRATVEEIAEAAGISRRTFFRYYPSRDDVLAGRFSRVLLHHIAGIGARPLDEPLGEALADVLRSSFVWEDTDLTDLTIAFARTYPDQFEIALERGGKLAIPAFAEVIADRLRSKGRGTVDATAIAVTFTSLLTHSYVSWFNERSRGSFSERFQEVLKDVADVLCLRL